MFEAGAIIWRIQTVGKQVLKQDLAESEAAANKAGAALDGAAKKTEDLGKKSAAAAPQVRTIRQEIRGMSEQAQQAATTVGRSFFIIGAAVAAATALTVKAAIDWETAWTGVTKTVDAPIEKLDEIEAGLRDLTKVLPGSHQEIAAVAEAAGQLGVRADDVVKFTKTMIDLGETTNLTSDEAATSLAQLMNIFQTAPEDVGRLGSAVVALGNNGASTERDIVQMSQRIAGAARIIGLSEGQTLGLANALASVGVEAEAGGSSVSNIMIDIANAVSSKGDKLLKWAELAGLGADEFSEKYRTKPAEALALVIEGMGRLNDSGGDVFKTLTDLGQTDIRVTRSLLGLAGAGNLLRDSLELGNQAWDENTALQIEAEKRYETTAAKLEIARNSIVDTAIDLGQYLLPAVAAVAEGVGDLTHFVAGLPPELTAAIPVFAVFTAAIFLAGSVALTAVPKVVAFRAALRTLTTDMPVATARARSFANFLGGPWGVALAAAGVALALLNNEMQKGVPTGAEVRNSLLSAASAADVLAAATKRTGLEQAVWGDYADSLKDLPGLLDKIGNDGFDWLNLSFNEQGTADSIRRVGDGLAEIAAISLPDAQAQFRRLTEEYGLNEKQQIKLLESMPGYRDALVKQATDLGVNVTSTDELANAQAILELALGDAGDKAEDTAGQLLTIKTAGGEVQMALDDVTEALRKFNDQQFTADDAISSMKQSALDLADAIGADGFTGTLDQSTQQGIDNNKMLREFAENTNLAAAEQLALTGSQEEANGVLEEGRQYLADIGAAFGLAGDDLQRFIDKYIENPTDLTYQAMVEGIEEMSSRLGTFYNTWNGRRMTIYTDGRISFGPGNANLAEADGGIVHFANGGLRENHRAQFARAGDVRVWAEPETGGEAYIPLSPAKRSTSVPVLAETADILGFDLVPRDARTFSDGGTTAGDVLDVSVPRAPQPIQLVLDGKVLFQWFLDEDNRRR